MTVGRILDPVEHDRKCWACQWTYGDLFRPGGQASKSQSLYERAVEAIEERRGSGPFTRPEVWRATHRTPTMYNVFGRALHDLRMHGLVSCVRMRNGKCYEWEVAL